VSGADRSGAIIERIRDHIKLTRIVFDLNNAIDEVLHWLEKR
jgi:hypothetical protein